MKIYCLFSGEYSSRELLGVYDEQHAEQAKKITSLISDSDIVEYELNSFSADEPPPGMKAFYYVEMKKNGDVEECGESSLLGSGGNRRDEGWYIEDKELHSWLRRSHWRLRLRTYARSREHAVKMANDLRAQILAGAKPRRGGYFAPRDV